MKLLTLYLIEYNGLTRRNKYRLWWYAAIIGIPLAAVILAWAWHGPSLNRLVGR